MIDKNNTNRNQKQNWDIFVNDEILLWIPDNLEKSETWSRILTKSIHGIRKNWRHSYVYIRLNTYTMNNDIETVLKPYQYIKTPGSKKNECIYLIPDCSDENVWAKVFQTGVIEDYARTFYILGMKPIHWQDTIDNLFKITQSLSKYEIYKEFEKELIDCLCLCYSIDENLVISRVNLTQNLVFSVLEKIAESEGLRIKINYRNH
jgi:hypothetical protein